MGLEACVIRLEDGTGRIKGTGFVVSSSLAVTCAHVVEAALGLPEGKLRIPQGDVKLDFPLLAPGRILTGRVTHWQPDRESRRH